MIFHVKFVVW